MRSRASQPVPLRRVLAAAFVILLAVGGVLALGEWLRHPGTDALPPDTEVSDPRDAVDCESPPVGEAASSGVLYDCPAVWDGRTVRLRGEVVGHPVGRGEGRWIQVNDDEYAGELGALPAHRFYRGGNSGVGVHLPSAMAERITTFGGPGVRGDVVEVIGAFHRVEPGSGEIAVIAAHDLVVLEPGRALSSDRRLDRQVVAYFLSGLALLVVLVSRPVLRAR